jgi:hypothetical protein
MSENVTTPGSRGAWSVEGLDISTAQSRNVRASFPVIPSMVEVITTGWSWDPLSRANMRAGVHPSTGPGFASPAIRPGTLAQVGRRLPGRPDHDPARAPSPRRPTYTDRRQPGRPSTGVTEASRARLGGKGLDDSRVCVGGES